MATLRLDPTPYTELLGPERDVLGPSTDFLGPRTEEERVGDRVGLVAPVLMFVLVPVPVLALGTKALEWSLSVSTSFVAVRHVVLEIWSGTSSSTTPLSPIPLLDPGEPDLDSVAMTGVVIALEEGRAAVLWEERLCLACDGDVDGTDGHGDDGEEGGRCAVADGDDEYDDVAVVVHVVDGDDENGSGSNPTGMVLMLVAAVPCLCSCWIGIVVLGLDSGGWEIGSTGSLVLLFEFLVGVYLWRWSKEKERRVGQRSSCDDRDKSDRRKEGRERAGTGRRGGNSKGKGRSGKVKEEANGIKKEAHWTS
jgi:hypothetical protein